MKKPLSIMALFLTAFALFAAEVKWEKDFDKAAEMSKTSGKPMFLLFTGSDWCPWCVKLEKEILSTKEFVDFSKDKFIFYKADFPSRKKINKKMAKTNKQLSEKYRVGGYPTVLILDSEGKVLHTTGYMKGGPSSYIKSLEPYAKAAAKTAEKVAE